MADKLLIVMVNTDPASTAQLGAVLSQAIVAAAMEYEVEIILAGRAADLAKSGVAADIIVQADGQRTAYDLICEAHQAGVLFKVCTPVFEAWGGELIAEIDESVGDAYLISEAMDDATVTFTY